MEIFTLNNILTHIRIHILGEEIYNKCNNGMPLTEAELIETTKKIFFPYHDEDNEAKINEAKNNIIQICKLKQSPEKTIKETLELREVELTDSKIVFNEYTGNDIPLYVKDLFKYKLRKDGTPMFSFGEINPTVLYHGSSKLFDSPYLLRNVVNRLTFGLSWAKLYAQKAKNQGGQIGFIYAYKLNSTIKNIIKYNGNMTKEISDKFSELDFPFTLGRNINNDFSNYMEGDEIYVKLCSTEGYRNDINGILAPNNNCEKQLILCRDGKVKLYLKNIYIYDFINNKVYQLL
jgi:hypothetical protein